MLLAWIAAGIFILVAPQRIGNVLHENFALPEIGSRDWGKKLFLRLAGLGLLAFAARFVWGIRQLFRLAH
jgi:hypothetical protein